jgi:predicted transcriptional regulator
MVLMDACPTPFKLKSSRKGIGVARKALAKGIGVETLVSKLAFKKAEKGLRF